MVRMEKEMVSIGAAPDGASDGRRCGSIRLFRLDAGAAWGKLVIGGEAPNLSIVGYSASLLRIVAPTFARCCI